MSDLTDLEIIKRIAEIVGCPYDDTGLIQAYGNWIDPLLDTMRAKAFCFDLMIKYKVDVSHYIDGTVDAYIDFNNQGATDSDANKAICLAIIKANSND